MKKLACLVPIAAVCIATLGVPASSCASVHTLFAGQTIPVGTVTVTDDGTNLTVTFTTVGGWVLMETHLHVATSLGGIPQKNGNPPPGRFQYKHENLGGVPQDPYTIPLGAWTPCTDLFIAAHAEVRKILKAAPYWASSVHSHNQGLRKNGTPVLPQRSVPSQGLRLETGQNERNFFSLGFGGWIIVQFDCPIRNGPGNDVIIWEDTWGTYPLETADIFASQDAVSWTKLGTANNLINMGSTFQHPSEFDLGALSWAAYIKAVDTTNPASHNATADGFDLNAVGSLQDCLGDEETAWGQGPGFPGANWATYIEYHVHEQ